MATGARDAPPWIGLAGPTASGKSAAALALAAALAQSPGTACEIVSVDSALVYRGMDIGTAKPTAAEQAAVPHHGIDLIEPHEAYSAARFVDDAERCMADIRARGRLPLLVGGTMLYFKALVDGLDALPAADADLRATLDREAAVHGWPAMHAQLAAVDPDTAARLAPHDAQRIQRALEVHRLTGRPMSALHRAAGRPAGRAPAGWLIGWEPASRGWLHERIAQRFDAMLDAGLLDEVRRLRADPRLHAGLPSMRCVGYRQAWEALDVDDPAPLGADALRATVRERGIAATRQLAKRQLTWLRSMPSRTVIECDAPNALDTLIDRVRERLAASQKGPSC